MLRTHLRILGAYRKDLTKTLKKLGSGSLVLFLRISLKKAQVGRRRDGNETRALRGFDQLWYRVFYRLLYVLHPRRLYPSGVLYGAVLVPLIDRGLVVPGSVPERAVRRLLGQSSLPVREQNASASPGMPPFLIWLFLPQLLRSPQTVGYRQPLKIVARYFG